MSYRKTAMRNDAIAQLRERLERKWAENFEKFLEAERDFERNPKEGALIRLTEAEGVMRFTERKLAKLNGELS